MHIGDRIREVLKSQGMPIADFADNLGCTRVHAHRILKKDNIDIILLKRISRLLNHDFFKEISECREFGYM